MYWCELDHKEGLAPKNWCFQIVVLEKTLESLGSARKSNQSILKEIKSEYSLEGLMLKLKLQYFGHLMQRANSLEKTLMLGKIEGKRRKGWWRMRWLDSITTERNQSEKTWGYSGGRRSLVFYSPRGRREYMTYWMNNNNIIHTSVLNVSITSTLQIKIYVSQRRQVTCPKTYR